MALFGFGKKKEEKSPACVCSEGAEMHASEEAACCCTTVEEADSACCSGNEVNTESGKKTVCCGSEVDGVCCIKVLGSNCKSCHALLENTQTAVKNLGLDLEIEYITDLQKVMEYGVMSMPGLVINDQVVSMGKVLKPVDIEKILHKFGV